MEKDKRLERAGQLIFSLGINDSGAKLAKKTMAYGLAKIHCLQEHLGYEPNAFFVGTPDLTITRNIYRFTNGIGYGGMISWGEGEDPFIPVDIKPNACGMLIGGLENYIDYKELISALDELKKDPGEIEGTSIKWDFNKSNHFINLFKVEGNNQLPPYIFVLHGAGDEFREDNDGQFGLYIDKSKILQSRSERLETPYGDINYICGEDADKYLHFYRSVEAFTQLRRAYVAGKLFGNYQLISDETHQGLTGLNEVILGCHKVNDNNTLFPLMLRADRPGYLLKGISNNNEGLIDKMGFSNRAKQYGVYHRLLETNLLPHGGGYTFPDIVDVDEIIEINYRRYFKLNTVSGLGKKIIQHPREIPYQYRGQEVLSRTMELEIGEIVAKLTPLFTLKI